MHPPRRRPGTVHIATPAFATHQPSTNIYRKIAYVFLALTVTIITLVLWLTSVRANVHIKVRKETTKVDGVVEIARNPSTGQIPGRVVQGTYEKIQEFTVMGDDGEVVTPSASTAPTTTETTPAPAQDVIARGKVKVINNYSKDQTLVRTTRLLTADGKLYRLDKQVVVPSGGSVSVDVYADKSGAEYAIGPTKFTIPGLYIDLQKHIFAQSDTAFVAVPKGSTPTPTPITPTPTPSKGKPVTATDLDRAQKQVTEAVLKYATDMLSADIANRESLKSLVVYNVIEQKNNVSVGQVAESFLSSVKLNVTIVYYAQEDMNSLIRARLKERVPQGRELVPAEQLANTFALESSDPKEERASIRVSSDASYRLSPQSPLLQSSVITGKSKAEAESILKAIDGVESVKIDISPSWLSTVPNLKERITVTVE